MIGEIVHNCQVALLGLSTVGRQVAPATGTAIKESAPSRPDCHRSERISSNNLLLTTKPPNTSFCASYKYKFDELRELVAALIEYKVVSSYTDSQTDFQHAPVGLLKCPSTHQTSALKCMGAIGSVVLLYILYVIFCWKKRKEKHVTIHVIKIGHQRDHRLDLK